MCQLFEYINNELFEWQYQKIGFNILHSVSPVIPTKLMVIVGCCFPFCTLLLPYLWPPKEYVFRQSGIKQKNSYINIYRTISHALFDQFHVVSDPPLVLGSHFIPLSLCSWNSLNCWIKHKQGRSRFVWRNNYPRQTTLIWLVAARIPFYKKQPKKTVCATSSSAIRRGSLMSWWH